MKHASSVYDAITAQIVAAIEAGNANGEWRMPWHSTGGPITCPINAVSRKPYRGINTLALWVTADRKGYTSGTWATYKQWNEMGAQVRRGEKSTLVVFWKMLEKAAENEDDEPEKRWIARAYSVFNANQVNGYTAPEVPTLDTSERVAQAEQFFNALGATVKHGYGMAAYSPKYDEIHMPDFARFTTAVGYYNTLGHEHVHYTGHLSRLNRDFSGRFGEEAYAFEELVAELGAAFLAAELGLTIEPREDHAVYINGWLHCLKQDARAIFTASSKAQAAVDWMKEHQSAV